MKLKLIAALAATVLGAAGAAQADDVVQKSFFPYAGGAVPTDAFAKPGTVIDASNVDQAKGVLDEAMYNIIKNGWYTIKIVPTEQYDINPNYVAATEKNYKTVSLGGPTGLTNFIAGRPFPQEPDVNDPTAGEKLAWNFKYGINWGDTATITPFYWTLRNMNDGTVERVLKMDMHFINFMHRTKLEPIPDITPNPSQMYRAIYVRVREPEDVANTQLLIHRFEDDSKRDEAWLYLGFQRRVRKLSTGQITDSFLGSDLMIEDIEGYNSRVRDMTWKFLGTKNILMPYYHHNELQLDDAHAQPDYKFVAFGGKGSCFPQITWQLRKVYEFEAFPVDPNHPISKRIFYFDAQTMLSGRTLIYDRGGKLWKTFTIGKTSADYHLPINKGSGIVVDDSFSMVDLQAMHCTTGQFKGQVDPSLSPVKDFTVDNLRSVN